MEHLQRLLLGLCLLLSVSVLYAQADASLTVFHIPNEAKNKPQVPNYKLKTPSYYRHHKKLPITYSGIVIELITNDLPLQRNHHLFKQFGNVYFDLLDRGGYSYCILTNFSDLAKAKSYLKSTILHRAPNAKVVKYQLGKRKKVG